MGAAAAQWSPQQAQMRDIIGRVATGPEYSKNISFDEARDAMRQILSAQADPVQAGIYLIALRMKRETDDENGGSLQAILDYTNQVTAAVDQVIDLAEPYDGFKRCSPVTPFLPAVLAACGLPTVSHGLEEVGPKFGVTHRKVLRAAGLQVDRTPAEAARQIEDPAIGWAYVDQAQSCPALHDLVPLRQRIIKRPVITTVEVLTGPIRGRRSTHLMTGYVHKPYPPVYEKLAKLSGFTSAVIVRGVEGGIAPSLNKPGKYFAYQGLQGPLTEVDLQPADADIHQQQRAVPVDAAALASSSEGSEPEINIERLAQSAAEQGIATLKGASGIARDSLTYTAAVMLVHMGRAGTLKEGVEQAGKVLDNGAALARLEAAR